MVLLFFAIFGGLIGGVVAAVIWWGVRGRRNTLPAGAAAAFTATAGILGLVVVTILGMAGSGIYAPFQLPGTLYPLFVAYRYAVPPLVGIVLLLLLAFPLRPRRGVGVADLAPRRLLTFTRRGWLIAPAVVFALIVLITVLAGIASRPDSNGQYTAYTVEVGAGGALGTTIYGWFFSVPALVVTLIMLAVAVGDLALISRPALRADRGEDARVRALRCRNVVAVATGALLLQLALIFTSLAGTASLQGAIASNIGLVNVWTPIAALGPTFGGASYVAEALGIALWAAVALSAVTLPHSARVQVNA